MHSIDQACSIFKLLVKLQSGISTDDISNKEEYKHWSRNVTDPKGLQNTMFYCVGKAYCT